MKRILIYLSLLIMGASCTYEFPDTDVKVNGGTADFSKFVCIGDNFTSGFMNGALYSEGQKNSIGSLISQQLDDASVLPFFQADINSDNGYNPFYSDSSNVYGKMVYMYPMINSEDPVIQKLPGEFPGTFDGDRNLLTDFSIPSLKSYQIADPGLSGNPYFNRIAVNPGTSTLLQQTTNASPTFFFMWLGLYDALHFAATGALGDYDPPSDPLLLAENDLTPEDVFENSIREIVAQLLSNPQTKGIIANLPSIEDFPFFYNYQYDFIRLSNSQKANAQNHYADFNLAVAQHNQLPEHEQRPFIDFNDNGQTLFPQPIVVYDDSLADGIDLYGGPLPKIRQLVPGEMVLHSLPIEQVQYGLGWMNPLSKNYYLNAFDVHVVQVAINKFNDIIDQVVSEYPDRLALVDLNTSIGDLASTGRVDSWGIPENPELKYIDGLPLRADLSINSAFSLDGLHFSQRGTAWVSNLIIDTINQYFGSNIPLLEVNQYVGNTILGSK